MGAERLYGQSEVATLRLLGRRELCLSLGELSRMNKPWEEVMLDLPSGPASASEGILLVTLDPSSSLDARFKQLGFQDKDNVGAMK